MFQACARSGVVSAELWDPGLGVVEVLSPLIRADRVTLVNKIAPNSIPHMEGDRWRPPPSFLASAMPRPIPSQTTVCR